MIRAAVLALTLALSSGLALAHHGFTGRYDLSQPVWIEGEVTKAYFGQPHATLSIRTPRDLDVPNPRPDTGAAARVIAIDRLMVREETRGREVEVEFPPIQAFFSMGDRVAVGDRITLIAFRNCDAPHQLRAQWLQPGRPGAAPAMRTERLRYQVDRC
jgi:hypothetical protein